MRDGSKKFRWHLWAVGSLALPLLYVVSSGPASYCLGREWMPLGLYSAMYGPLSHAVNDTLLSRPYVRYTRWFWDTALHHEFAGAEGPPICDGF